MKQHDEHHDPNEPIVVWLDRVAAQHEQTIAAVRLTFDHPETLTFHSLPGASPDIPIPIPSREEWLRCLDYLVHVERHVHFETTGRS